MLDIHGSGTSPPGPSYITPRYITPSGETCEARGTRRRHRRFEGLPTIRTPPSAILRQLAVASVPSRRRFVGYRPMSR